ncbi:MAG: urea ABC transporter ATP-binding protein UrtD [Desulfovibrio sp.]|jgi:urea transport system ATP-binding protein|nr:urea ABC transporter ATP-binding protein UrtD [Desulfovibrio sp.]
MSAATLAPEKRHVDPASYRETSVAPPQNQSDLDEAARAILDDFNSRRHGLRPGRQIATPPKALRGQNNISLYLEKISVSFDGFKALNNLTIYIDEGELRCIIGPNGAGKTTMMDVITGKTKPDRGSAWFTREHNLLALDEVGITEAGIGRKFQKPSVFEELSVLHNLELALKGKKSVFGALRARLSGEDKDFLEQTLKRIRLQEQRDMPTGRLSHGQKQWLEIGMLLAQKPKMLLLDEPVAGMTVREIERTIELLRTLEGEQSIILVEHDMEFVRAVAGKVTVLHQGSVLAEGNMDQIRNNQAVIEAYLGESQC